MLRRRLWNQLFAFPGLGRRWRPGLRSAIAFVVPALIGELLGFHGSLYVGLGVFAVMYGEDRPYASRWRLVLGVGLVLLGAMALGVTVGRLIDGQIASLWVFAVTSCVVAFIGVAVDMAPPGSFFWFLVCTIGLQVGQAGKPAAPILIWLAVGVGASLLVTMSGALVDRTQPERAAVAAADRAVREYEEQQADPVSARSKAAEAMYSAWAAIGDARLDTRADHPLVRSLSLIGYRFRAAHPDLSRASIPTEPFIAARPSVRYRIGRALSPDSHEFTTAVRVLVAGVLVVAVVSLTSSWDRPQWALVAAALVLWQGPTPIVGTIRAVHRFVGTLLGLAVLMGIVWLSPPQIILVVIFAGLLFLIDFFVASNYAAALAFITPVALLTSFGGHIDSIDMIVNERALENFTGVALAVGTLWAVLPRAQRRRIRWSRNRVIDSATALIGRLDSLPTNSPVVQRLRSQLHYELIDAARARAAAEVTEPAWAAANTTRILQAEDLGYQLLADCRSAPDGAAIPQIDVGRWGERFTRLV